MRPQPAIWLRIRARGISLGRWVEAECYTVAYCLESSDGVRYENLRLWSQGLAMRPTPNSSESCTEPACLGAQQVEMFHNWLTKILLVDDEPGHPFGVGGGTEGDTGYRGHCHGSRGSRFRVPGFTYIARHHRIGSQHAWARMGWQCASVWRANPRYRDIPIVFLSTLDEQEAVEEVMRAGATAYLSKPFDPMTVGREILTAIGYGESH